MRFLTIILSLIGVCAYAGPHTLQRGESLEDVAKLYYVSLDSLKKYNPDVEVYAGYTIDIPIENHFYDLGESDIFRKIRYNLGGQKEKGEKKYKSAYEKQLKLYKYSSDKKVKLQDEIKSEYEEAAINGNLDALYQLGRRYIHGKFYSHNATPDFSLDINENLEEFNKGIEYMQIVGLLTKKASAYIYMAVACGHEDSPIRNPYLCISMLEVFADSKSWPVKPLICYMYENGYGINKNLMQAYVYCEDSELIGDDGHLTKREKLLKQISDLPNTNENSFYGNELETSAMITLGLSYYKNNKIDSQGLYWLHKAANSNDADANWTLAGLLKNGNYKSGEVGSIYDIDQQVIGFVEKAAELGHTDAKEYLTAYKKAEAEREEQQRLLAQQKQQREAEKKARRRQMWTNIAGTLLQAAIQTAGQLEYAKQMSRANAASIHTYPSINGLSGDQWLAKQRLAMDQILQYSINKSISDWNGTPMAPTNMSAVDLGNDMTPGGALWSWNMQQQINTISTRQARMRCETLAFYRRQTDMIEQQLRENPYQPIAGYVNSDGLWISGEMVGNAFDNSSESAASHSGIGTSNNNNHSYDHERYGYIECRMCHGTGQCITCNGSGIMNNRLTAGSSECPNCYLENMRRTGKCSSCQGKGTKYGLK